MSCNTENCITPARPTLRITLFAGNIKPGRYRLFPRIKIRTVLLIRKITAGRFVQTVIIFISYIVSRLRSLLRRLYRFSISTLFLRLFLRIIRPLYTALCGYRGISSVNTCAVTCIISGGIPCLYVFICLRAVTCITALSTAALPVRLPTL